MTAVKVPATTANIGPGFDCIGMALDIYNELTVEEADKFSIEIASGADALSLSEALNEENMIYQAITHYYSQIGKQIPTLRLIQNDEIPIARGLGSSAACIVAGLMAANELSGLRLSREELAKMASRIEGHPDNVVPAILGGMIVGAMDSSEIKYVKVTPSDDLSFVLCIPGFTVHTSKARGVLPAQYTREDAVFNASRTALLAASMMSGNWDNLRMATQDRIHQPYRAQLIPDMDAIFDAALELDAKGVFLSGAGPTIIAIVMKKYVSEFVRELGSRLKTLSGVWEIKTARADNDGAQIIKEGSA